MSSVDLALRAFCATDQRPMVLAEEDLSVRWSNEAAQARLTRGHALLLSDYRLRAADAAETVKLEVFLSRWPGGVRTHVVLGSGGTPNSVLRARHADVDERRLFLLLIREVAPPSPFQLDGAREALKLTQAEARVAEMMMLGQTLEGIALGNKTSLETVRSHVKNLFTKLAVTTRAELHAVLSSYIWM